MSWTMPRPIQGRCFLLGTAVVPLDTDLSPFSSMLPFMDNARDADIEAFSVGFSDTAPGCVDIAARTVGWATAVSLAAGSGIVQGVVEVVIRS